MKRTRRWEFVKQDALRLAALGLSADEIANQVGVDRATVFRWKKAGKLQVGSGSSADAAQVPLVTTDQTSAQWAAAVRAAYALDVTDSQIVTIAESALLVAKDPGTPGTLRLAAMREFRAAVKQLGLVARAGAEDGTPAPEPAVPAKRKTFQVQRRGGGDPRSLLH